VSEIRMVLEQRVCKSSSNCRILSVISVWGVSFLLRMGRIEDERRSKVMGLNVLSDMTAIDLRRSRNISASIGFIEDGSIEWR